MDYSHLHTYAPPQCLPDNTGYTYALSSSYSSEALDFETIHKLAPVFDSPRMSRRSLRLKTSMGNYADESLNDSTLSHRSVRQQHNSSRQSSSSHQSASRKSVTNTSFQSQSSFNSQIADTSVLSSVLDASVIREQTEVSSIWGLDDEELIKDGNTTVIQSNGDFNSAETQTTMVNGYTCSDCSIVSQRNDALTALSASYSSSGKVHATSGTHTACGMLHTGSTITNAASGNVHAGSANAHTPSSSMHTSSTRVYSRDRSQKNKSSDDYNGTKHHEMRTTIHTQSSWARGVTGTLWHTLYYTGYLLLQAVRSVGAAGWFVSRKMLSFLWLAIVSPGRAASSLLWWLGTGWYQLATLVSLLNVFILTRCLSKLSKLLLLLLPLLILLGLYLWGSDYILLPAFGGLRIFSSDVLEETAHSLEPSPESTTISSPGTKEEGLPYDTDRIRELEKQFGLMGRKHNGHMEDYKKLNVLVLKIQEQVQQMNDESHLSSIITNMFEQHFAKHTVEKKEPSVDASSSTASNHEARIVHLEALFAKLSQAIEEDRKLAESRTSRGEIHDESLLRRRIESLEEEFETYKAAFTNRQTAQTSCDLPDCLLQKVDARVKESIHMMFASQENIPESLLQWLSANYVNKGDFNSRLQELELKILQNITHHVILTKQVPSAKVVETAITGAIDGISKQETQAMINNALRLYSQDRTGMADFALESGGGSILGTRCSETYGTKTALMSLFGIPLWYFSQSPRVVIQPDMYPGNCWAFKGTQGYLVVRLSRMIYPTAFSIEHIPKSLSPLGNITSAPKDFAVYGLDDEYQEDGQVLIRAVYDQEGEPLQIFHIMEEYKKPFQIVELRIFSNWGHQDFTCLYRFRAHGTPVQ
ncbi:SUN domain-containing protein 1 isoform X7 [Xenopus tropicalis]|uniref:SUN domain-containing protein 1 isoform X7 n=1 Tax=Xenopus tropicalis TaxID=8364 RepID=A0A6I8SGH0_XENTR|nr:SUN domain-containing protein 1 isoform X7 [Xenopus tropicalis]